MQRLAILLANRFARGPDPTGLFQHGVGLLWVVVARFQANIGVWHGRGEKRVGHLLRTVQRIVDQRFFVHRVIQRFTHRQFVRGSSGGVQGQHHRFDRLRELGTPGRVMAETSEGIQRQQAFVAVKQIDIAGFKSDGAGHRVRNHFHGHLADRRFVTPVAVVTYQHIILVELRGFQHPGAGADRRFDTVLCSPFNKLRRGDKTERARQRQLLQERGVGAFERNLQLRIAERPHVGNLIGQLQPGMALSVSQYRLEVGDRGLRIERLAVRKLHVVTQSKAPHFPVRRVAPVGGQPRFYRAIRLILYQRLIHHALGKHLVGGIQVRVQRTHVHRPGGSDIV